MLILPLSLYAISAMAAPEILTDKELSNKFVSVLKDVEVENLLAGSTEFNECRKKNEFDPKVSAAEREKKAKSAEECFKEKLSRKNTKDLQELSNNLGLQSYGLVQSNNVKAISSYLGDKMYKAMTGIDRKDKENKDMLKFENRKLIDQKVFIQLYTTQLGKSALFEISRFCFENLRLKNAPADSDKDFVKYWGKVLANPNATVEVVDTGSGGFGEITNTTDEGAIYKDIFKGISADANFNVDQLGGFFDFCSGKIRPLCDEFEKAPKESSDDKMPVGANACLTKEKLQNIRKAISSSELVKEQFEKDLSGGFAVSLDNGLKAKFYDRGKSDESKSLDNLTNVASIDMLKGGTTEGQEDMAAKCAKEPERKDCEGYLVVDDSRQKVEHAADMDLRMKKEMEKARVREIKKDNGKGLEEYLTDNGYFDLLEKWNNDKNLNIEEEIDKIFEAKRIATLGAIQNKLGKRQVSEDEITKKGLDKKELTEVNVKEAQEERARLAQVVLFNNIITSHLKLVKKEGDTEVEVGRNVNAWKKEQQGLENAKQIDQELFAGIKNSIKPDEGGGGAKDNSIVGIGMLDSILGKGKED